MGGLNPTFCLLHSVGASPSIPPKLLLRELLLQAICGIRQKLMLAEKFPSDANLNVAWDPHSP